MSEINRAELGGKGAALRELEDAGFGVPPFVIIPVSFFKSISPDDPEATGKIIASCAAHLPAWEEVLGTAPVAVRSSAASEDAGAHSFAGQFKTLLDVPFEKVPEAVAEVWLSAGGHDAYRTAHGLPADGRMAVVLQVMIPATAAGVAFSAHPVQGTEMTVINAVEGLGDKLVDGSSNGDEYHVHAGRLIYARHSEQPVLSAAQALEVAAAAVKAQQHFGRPQDIEFAFNGESLAILQSRPITTLPPKATVWDNSNIVESYPGLTGPLTFSFIQKMYDAVYRQFSALLGVSKSRIGRHAPAFAQMLGLLNGRVYYNLNSWYEALALLPGYSINASFMEKMMGVKEKPDITITAEKTGRLKAWWEIFRGVTGILKNAFTARRQAAHFTASFNKVYCAYSGQDFDKKSGPALWDDYCSFEQLMVREWKAPLVNDFFAMIYFGLLQKMCLSLAPEEPDLHNRLLAGSDAVLTTEPMRLLPRIADAIRADATLLQIALTEPAEALHAALQLPQHRDAFLLFSEYIALWGERTVAELKLETVTYRQNPLMLLSLLQSGLREERVLRAGTGIASSDRKTAAAFAEEKLAGHRRRRALFRHVLKSARYFVSQRENLRYYRTRGFGMVRRLMLAMGSRLAEANVIDAAGDIFWLTLPELETIIKAPAPAHSVVASRKNLYRQYETAPLPQRLRTYGMPPGLISLQQEPAPRKKEGDLQGIPCSAGIVRAPVRLVTYSDDLKSLDGALLVTYATDPGFVVLFASASGILTERGSLLSHAAIVSREMGIPCIVGIDDLMQSLKNGDIVEMDGSTGSVKIISA